MDESPTAGTILAKRTEALPDPGFEVSAVVEGDELVMVQTEVGLAGVAMNPEGPIPDVTGNSTYEVARQGATATDTGTRAVGVAALNAIDPPNQRQPGLDPFRSLDPETEQVAMVGLFGPVLKHLDAGHVDVFERNPQTVTVPESLAAELDTAMHPPAAASELVPEAEVLFITGSSLVWGGIETYLQAARPDQTVVVVGASASFGPQPLFEAGVSMVAGASVTDPEHVRRAITGGKSEADLHDGGLTKWAVVDPTVSSLPGLCLD
ncbi:Rossmann-like domain-containing protein [Halodesulfurarchaeum sp.]|uniref:Rossmann-like domain-containing protein n=1 Tax=Halodesulfurarchaeum sp. TaxID=1980530 RepID=UPI001BC29D33|nr:hypothetical protein [Halodesulfurarchaeum sp.]